MERQTVTVGEESLDIELKREGKPTLVVCHRPWLHHLIITIPSGMNAVIVNNTIMIAVTD